MLVYIAGAAAPGRKEAVREFGDEPLAAWELPGCGDEGLRLVLALAALGRCQAILLPEGWRGDTRAALEKAFADARGIPEVMYFSPGAGRRR